MLNGVDPVARFWGRVKSGGTAGCWEWPMWRFKSGYGQTWYHGKQWRSHRLAWTLTNGEPTPGMDICHTCDNPPCCNPDHLFLGTRRENVMDMMSKRRNRQPIGAASGRAVLSYSSLPQIFERYMRGDTCRSIGADFGVAERTIVYVVSGKSWSHVRRPEGLQWPRRLVGSRTAGAKLNELQVAKVKSMIRAGIKDSVVASRYGIQRATVYAIRVGKTWSHVPWPN